MTTFIALTLNNSLTPPFSTSLTLDGTSYLGAVTWNLAGQRWYLSIIDQSGSVTWCGALVGSPLDYDIYLAPGVFQHSTILFREDTGNIEVNP
jgi:hypothetical protein